MKEKVLIPTRGVIALDIINSLNSMGMETLLMHSPEDSLSLPVKLADRSYKFYSSRLEDSYLDMEAIIEKAREVHADYLHPGYGFLAENPEFARLCKDNGIRFIGPDSAVLALVEDKIKLRETGRRPGAAGPEILGTDQEPPRFRGRQRRLQLPDHHQTAERLRRPGHPRGRLPARCPGTDWPTC